MKLAGGASTPSHASEQTLGRRSPANQTPVEKQTATCRDFVWSSDMPSAERCDESVPPSMQTVVKADAWTGKSASTTG